MLPRRAATHAIVYRIILATAKLYTPASFLSVRLKRVVVFFNSARPFSPASAPPHQPSGQAAPLRARWLRNYTNACIAFRLKRKRSSSLIKSRRAYIVRRTSALITVCSQRERDRYSCGDKYMSRRPVCLCAYLPYLLLPSPLPPALLQQRAKSRCTLRAREWETTRRKSGAGENYASPRISLSREERVDTRWTCDRTL